MQAAWPLAVVGAVHLLADVNGTLDLVNDTEIRGRSSQNVTPNPSLDVVDTAGAKLGVVSRRWDFGVGYTASVLEADAELLTPPTFIQAGDVSGRWQDSTVTIGLSQSGSYGRMNTATTGQLPQPDTTAGSSVAQPAGAPGTPAGAPTTMPPSLLPSVQLLAPATTLQYVASRSALTAVDRIGPLDRIELVLEYDISGGVDPTSQTVMPLVHGPRGKLAYDRAFSPRDTLDIELVGQRSDTSAGLCSPFIPADVLVNPNQPCDPTGQIEQLTGGWRYRVSPTTEVSAGAGIAFTQVRFQNAQASFDDVILPVALAGIQHTESVGRTETNLHLDFELGPFVDLRTGVIDERAQVTGAAVIPTPDVKYAATVGATRSVESPYIAPMSSVQATLEADYVASRVLAVGGGARYIWQDQADLGTFSVAMIFVNLTWRAPTIRF